MWLYNPHPCAKSYWLHYFAWKVTGNSSTVIYQILLHTLNSTQLGEMKIENTGNHGILSISWLFPKKEALARWPLVTALSYTNYTQQISLQMREIIYGQDQRVNRHKFDGVDPVVLYPLDIYCYCIYALDLSPQWMWWGEWPHLLTSLLFHLLLSCWILYSFTTLGSLMCDILFYKYYVSEDECDF